MRSLGTCPPRALLQLIAVECICNGTFWGEMEKPTNSSLNEGREQAEAWEGILGGVHEEDVLK